jgi:Electron transfer flavoprotein, beta subunit
MATKLLQVDGPCVVTVLSGAYKPRYMTVSGIVGAYEKEVEFWGFEQIDVVESKLGLKRLSYACSQGILEGCKSARRTLRG